MRFTIADLLARLRAEGLAPLDADRLVAGALLASEEDEAPWYIRAAVGFGAWIATGFLLAFVLAFFDLSRDATRIVLGLILVALAIWLRRGATGEFVRQGAVAVALLGQGLVIVGAGEMFDSTPLAGFAGLLLSLALIALIPDRVLRFLTTVIGSASALVAVSGLREPIAHELAVLALVAVATWVWRIGVRERDEDTAAMLEPVGYGLIVSVFLALAFSGASAGGLSRELGTLRARAHLGPLTTVGITATLVALALAVLREHGTPWRSRLGYAVIAGVAALGLGTLSSPGIVAGAAVLVLAFDRRNPVLMGLGVVFLLAFGSVYYYSLSLTLLEKSGVLVGTGLLFLAIRSRLGARSDPRGAP